jgi:hypothetical protein
MSSVLRLHVNKELGCKFMHIDDFIWLPHILDKLAAKHNVTQDEAEDVFLNGPRYRFVERDTEQVKASTQ